MTSALGSTGPPIPLAIGSVASRKAVSPAWVGGEANTANLLARVRVLRCDAWGGCFGSLGLRRPVIFLIGFRYHLHFHALDLRRIQLAGSLLLTGEAGYRSRIDHLLAASRRGLLIRLDRSADLSKIDGLHIPDETTSPFDGIIRAAGAVELSLMTEQLIERPRVEIISATGQRNCLACSQFLVSQPSGPIRLVAVLYLDRDSIGQRVVLQCRIGDIDL